MSTRQTALAALIEEAERANKTALREFGIGLIDLNAISAAKAALSAPVVPQAGAGVPEVLQDGRWYWVRYEGFGKTYEAPAMYKANAKAFYSHQFSGIQVHEVQVLAALSTPTPPPHPEQGGEDVRELSKWLNEEVAAPINRQTLARVLHRVAQQPSAERGGDAPSVEAAREMGAKGGPVVQAERLAFEAWMAGHCWKVSPTWNGREYDDSEEDKKRKLLDPLARITRMLWAAWRDRAALAAQPSAPAQGEVAVKLERDTHGRCVVSLRAHGQWVPVIRDYGDAISHVCEPAGIAAAIASAQGACHD